MIEAKQETPEIVHSLKLIPRTHARPRRAGGGEAGRTGNVCERTANIICPTFLRGGGRLYQSVMFHWVPCSPRTHSLLDCHQMSY